MHLSRKGEVLAMYWAVFAMYFAVNAFVKEGLSLYSVKEARWDPFLSCMQRCAYRPR